MAMITNTKENAYIQNILINIICLHYLKKIQYFFILF